MSKSCHFYIFFFLQLPQVLYQQVFAHFKKLLSDLSSPTAATSSLPYHTAVSHLRLQLNCPSYQISRLGALLKATKISLLL